MSTFYMPPRGAPGSPVFDPDNVRSLLGFFDDLKYCFDAAGVQDETAKKQHATRYAPDSEKTIWRTFPEFADSGSDFDAFKDAIIKDYIGGSLFSIHDLTSLVEATAKTGISSIKAFSEYSRRFRDIASSLVSSGYLRDHERDHLFLQGIEDSLRQAVLQRLHVTQPFILFPRHQYSIEQVTTAAHHVLDSAITPATTAPSQPELVEATQALAAAQAAFLQLQRQQQFLSQPISRLSTFPTPASSTPLSVAHSRPPVPATTHNDFVPGFDYEERLAQMRRQLAALEQQRAALRAASYVIPSEDCRIRTADNSGMQLLADRRAALMSPQPEPHEDRYVPVSEPAVPPTSRFKLPVVYISTTPATPASTTQRATALSSPTSFEVQLESLSADVSYTFPSLPPDRSSRPLTAAQRVTPSVYRHLVSNQSPPLSCPAPIRHPPVSAPFTPAIPPPCPVYHHAPLIPSPPPSHLSSTPFSPRPVSPPSNAPTPPSQASHPVAAHPCSLLHSTSILNIPSPPSPPSPRSPAPPSSPTTPSDSDYSANAVSETSSFAKPLPSSSPASSLTIPLQKYVCFPPFISRSLTVIFGYRLRRLDTFDFLFSFIRPPSPMTRSLLPTGMRRPSRSLTRMLASQATQSPAPIQHRTHHALRLRALRTPRQIAPSTYPSCLHITRIASPRRLPLQRTSRVQVCTSNSADMKSRHDCALRPRFSRRLTHLRITLSTMLDDDIPRRTHARTGRPASDPRRPPVRFDSSEEEPLSPSCTTPCSQRDLLHAPLAASPPYPPCTPRCYATVQRMPAFPLRAFSRPPRVHRAHVPLTRTRNHAVPPLPPLSHDEFGPRTVQI